MVGSGLQPCSIQYSRQAVLPSQGLYLDPLSHIAKFSNGFTDDYGIFDLYPLAVAAPALLFWLWRHSSPRQALLEGWLFGIGLLGPGVSWLHISIDQFGNVGTPLAIFITLLFILSLALFYGLAGWLGRRLPPHASAATSLLLFTLLWVLMEFLWKHTLTPLKQGLMEPICSN